MKNENRKKIREKKRLSKEKAKRELDAINNHVNQTEQAKTVRSKFEQKSKRRIGISKHNKNWEQKRINRYNQKRWKGWRTTDGKASPVISYSLKTHDEQE